MGQKALAIKSTIMTLSKQTIQSPISECNEAHEILIKPEPRLLLFSVGKKCGFYSKAVSIYNCLSQSAASIRRWLVFKDGLYLRKYGIFLIAGQVERERERESCRSPMDWRGRVEA